MFETLNFKSIKHKREFYNQLISSSVTHKTFHAHMDEISLDDIYVKITHEKINLEIFVSSSRSQSRGGERRGRKQTTEKFLNSLNFNVPLKTFSGIQRFIDRMNFSFSPPSPSRESEVYVTKKGLCVLTSFHSVTSTTVTVSAPTHPISRRSCFV